ncbi:MAG TPA: class I SAM-dependent methyltransferase [Vicinamibacterales bacterium]|nr:class I SAM-dependent methyltransferase [Vicinamibacterales bacterium]
MVLFSGTALAQTEQKPPYEPQVGQAGKDVVWVPTPQTLVEKMLDMAEVTPADYVIDLGSGDGRTVITAAKRGATALGVEYNPDMVTLSEFNAKEAGVSDKARFVRGDIFEYDFSKANVITMFLLPSINMTLRPKLLDMRPGTRIVTNSFTMEDWEADQSETVNDDCTSWCTAHLWIVPAKVEGAWQLPQGTLTLTQEFQNVSGTLGSTAITGGKMDGADIEFSVGGQKYTGTLNGDTMKGTSGNGQSWTATRK